MKFNWTEVIYICLEHFILVNVSSIYFPRRLHLSCWIPSMYIYIKMKLFQFILILNITYMMFFFFNFPSDLAVTRHLIYFEWSKFLLAVVSRSPRRHSNGYKTFRKIDKIWNHFLKLVESIKTMNRHEPTRPDPT